jgi:hypothetical protein
VPNLYEPDFDAEQDREPFKWRRARIGRQAGTQKLGASLFEIEPGASTFQLHAHHANEELLVVVAGTPTLRTIDGERELAAGEARVLIVSTMLAPEINEFPETGRLWARSYAPGTEPGEHDVEIDSEA